MGGRSPEGFFYINYFPSLGTLHLQDYDYGLHCELCFQNLPYYSFALSSESQKISGRLFAGLFWLNFKIIAISLNRCHFTGEMIAHFKISVDPSFAGLCHHCARRCLLTPGYLMTVDSHSLSRVHDSKFCKENLPRHSTLLSTTVQACSGVNRNKGSSTHALIA